MAVRGDRNPFPSKGGKPTGMFSTRGKQKQDGASGPNMGTLAYAHGHRVTKPSGGNGSKRHQKPVKQW